ncbi:MAG TPA: serine hydrolase domain-containing protein [Gemmatimonadales bacterium]|nr:serine hydrolase domain-containing protein [Gemmatimonadales bacterium]
MLRFALAAFALLGPATTSLAGQAKSCPAAETAALRTSIQALLDSIVSARPDIPGVSLHVEAPRHCLSWSGAAGVSDRATGTKLSPDQPHRMASNTKTYVAAATLRLYEDAKLKLDAPIATLLSKESIETLRRGGYDPDVITVRHLVTHTSGIFDYAMSTPYQEAVFGSPNKRWTREEQLRFAVDKGQPYGAPGTVFKYSDTGYILLGEIIERVSGQPLAAALGALLNYRKNGWKMTWLETLQPEPAGVLPRAHQYFGALDTYAWDPSFDLYGGGGLAATMRDMGAFTRGLFEGKVYRKKETLDLMLSQPSVPTERTYRYGIYSRNVGGFTAYGHTGFWNTFSFHVPDLDLTVAASLTQQEKAYDVGAALLAGVVERAK